jgi:uncharacterized protein YbaA (DUF1428 family)
MLLSNKIALSLATAALLVFSGCGGGSSDSDPVSEDPTGVENPAGDEGTNLDGDSNTVTTTTNIENGTISGNAIDGYVRNALVCLDVNRNSECDDSEPYSKTTSTGTYSLDISSYTEEQLLNAQILVNGGVDSDTGKQFEGRLKAPFKKEGVVHVTPLTTVVADILEQNGDDVEKASEASKLVAESLGIDESKVDSDYVEAQKTKADDVSVMQAALQLQKTVEIMVQSVQRNENKTQSEATKDVIKSLASELKNGKNTSLTKAIEKVAQEKSVASNVLQAAKDIADAVEDAMSEVAKGEAVESMVMLVEQQKESVHKAIESDSTEDIAVKTSLLDGVTLSTIENEMHLSRLFGLAGIELEDETRTTVFASLTGVDASTSLEQLKTKVEESSLEDSLKTALTQQLNVAVLEESVSVDVKASTKDIAEEGFGTFKVKDGDSNELGYDTIRIESMQIKDGKFTGFKSLYDAQEKKFEHYEYYEPEEFSFRWVDGSWKNETEFSETATFSEDESIGYLKYNDTIVDEFRFIAIKELSGKADIFIDNASKPFTITAPEGAKEYLFEMKKVKKQFEFRTQDDGGDRSRGEYENLEAFVDTWSENGREESHILKDGDVYLKNDYSVTDSDGNTIGSWSIVAQTSENPSYIDIKVDGDTEKWITSYFIYNGKLYEGETSSGIMTMFGYSKEVYDQLGKELERIFDGTEIDEAYADNN